MKEKRHPRRYDHVGSWFMTPQASKWGLVFTIIFGLQWTKDNAERLKTNLRTFIHKNIASGNSSMHLPRNSPIVSRPVLAEFAKWYTITTKIKLSCMWHQFTPKAKPCK